MPIMIEALAYTNGPAVEWRRADLPVNGRRPIWTYSPVGAPDELSKNIIVAKTPGYPRQYIIGPKPAVQACAGAFYVLDAIGVGELRHMTVIINPYIDAKVPEDQVKKGQLFLTELAVQFHVEQKIQGSDFTAEELSTFGLIDGVREPVFSSHDVVSTEELHDDEHALGVAYYAGLLRHEWAHVEQFRLGLPGISLWSERQALSTEAQTLLFFLRQYKRLNILEQETLEETLVESLSSLSETIASYRNGRGFEDHLAVKETNGTPHKPQTLHREDFAFGY